jgi:YHS domain-containing protein
MKRFALWTGALLMLASAALAGPPPKDQGKKPEKTPTTIKCPVMPGSSVNIKDATAKKMYADYKGRRYFFCCPGCPDAFKSNPAKYAKAPSIPTPKKEAPKKS